MGAPLTIPAGTRFGGLTVIVQRNPAEPYMHCRCDCGNECQVPYNDRKRNRSCGRCVKRGENNGRYSHGMAGTKIYMIWSEMIARCSRPSHKRYADYGGRGITVCDRWLDFVNFYADMGERPPDRSLDRTNNDKGYSPDNCRWATAAEQRANRRPERLPDECSNGHRYPPPEDVRRTRDGKRRCLQCERDQAKSGRERRPKPDRNIVKSPAAKALDAAIAAEYMRLGATYEAVQAIAAERGIRTETVRLRIRRAGIEVLDGRTGASRAVPIKRPSRFTDQQQSEILRLRAAGMSQEKIGARFGTTQSSIRRFLISESQATRIEDAA